MRRLARPIHALGLQLIAPCPGIHGETVPVTGEPGLSAWWHGVQRSGRSAPPVGGHRGSHQRMAQLA
jgi:hypothetical protein